MKLWRRNGADIERSSAGRGCEYVREVCALARSLTVAFAGLHAANDLESSLLSWTNLIGLAWARMPKSDSLAISLLTTSLKRREC